MELKSQFKARTPERVYLAVATGRVEADAGGSCTPSPSTRRASRCTSCRGREGQLATLSYRVLERFPDATLLEVRLETGRRNQIRVQLAATGHALIGDVTYGEPSPLSRASRSTRTGWRSKAPRATKASGSSPRSRTT
jgi:23S rRNA pseudouridine1911/1915/1917 synthase